MKRRADQGFRSIWQIISSNFAPVVISHRPHTSQWPRAASAQTPLFIPRTNFSIIPRTLSSLTPLALTPPTYTPPSSTPALPPHPILSTYHPLLLSPPLNSLPPPFSSDHLLVPPRPCLHTAPLSFYPSRYFLLLPPPFSLPLCLLTTFPPPPIHHSIVPAYQPSHKPSPLIRPLPDPVSPRWTGDGQTALEIRRTRRSETLLKENWLVDYAHRGKVEGKKKSTNFFCFWAACSRSWCLRSEDRRALGVSRGIVGEKKLR